MNRALAFVVALTLPALSFAQCRTNQCAPYVAPTVVATPIVTTFAVPLYGAGYDDSAERNRELMAKLAEQNDRLTKLVERLAADKAPAGPDVPTTAPPSIDVFAVFNRSCAGCHSGDKPKGGFSFAGPDGRFRELGLEDQAKIKDRIGRTGAGVMPPPGAKNGPALSAAEKEAVRAALTDGPKPVAVAKAAAPAPPAPAPVPLPNPPAPAPPALVPLFAKGDVVRLKGVATPTAYRVLCVADDRVLVEDLMDPGHVGTLPMGSVEKKP